jgi:hypothetical protein
MTDDGLFSSERCLLPPGRSFRSAVVLMKAVAASSRSSKSEDGTPPSRKTIRLQVGRRYSWLLFLFAPGS